LYMARGGARSEPTPGEIILDGPPALCDLNDSQHDHY